MFGTLIVIDMLPYYRTLLITTFNLSNKSKTANMIILYEDHKIKNKKVSHTLNKYFTDLSETLKLKKISPALKKKPVENLLKHLNHQSIKKMQKHFKG